MGQIDDKIFQLAYRATEEQILGELSQSQKKKQANKLLSQDEGERDQVLEDVNETIFEKNIFLINQLIKDNIINNEELNNFQQFGSYVNCIKKFVNESCTLRKLNLIAATMSKLSEILKSTNFNKIKEVLTERKRGQNVNVT